MMMNINPVIRQTLSQNVKKNLMDYFFSLQKSATMKLPAESELAEMFGVSRVTIRRVLDEMEVEGLVIRIHGKGTFVNGVALKIDVNLAETEEFGEIIRKSGYTPGFEVLEMRTEPIIAGQAKLFNLSADDRIIVIETLYYAGGNPTIYSIDRIPEIFFNSVPTFADLEKNTFFTVLYEFAGMIVTRAKTDFKAITKQEMKADTDQYTRMTNDALLRTESIAYDQKNKPVLYGITFYDTRFLNFSLMRSYI